VAGGAAAKPFTTHYNALDYDFHLRISLELYLKRLIVGGLEKVYELAKDFRNEGVSYKHSPEFTQLEWYEAYADYRDTMERLETLVERAAQGAIGGTQVTFRGHDVDLAPPWQRVKFVEALEAHGAWSRDPDELRAKLDEAEVDTSHDQTWAQLVDHAYSHFVEPELIQPTVVHDWPIEMSPFARTTDDAPAIVERFESVCAGMEFANAFRGPTDAEEQARRFAMDEVLPVANELDPEKGEIPPSLLERIAELGYFGITVPAEFGGLGAESSTVLTCTEIHAPGHVIEQCGWQRKHLAPHRSCPIPDHPRLLGKLQDNAEFSGRRQVGTCVDAQEQFATGHHLKLFVGPNAKRHRSRIAANAPYQSSGRRAVIRKVAQHVLPAAAHAIGRHLPSIRKRRLTFGTECHYVARREFQVRVNPIQTRNPHRDGARPGPHA